MYGARISLLVGVASVLLSMLIGVSLGLLAGFVGGKTDAFIMRVCDVMLSFPAILVALLIDGVGRALLPNAHDTLAFAVLIIAIALTGLGAVRAHGARLDAGRAQQGIRAGRARDRRARRCASCVSHVLPNVLGPVLVLATIQVGHGDHHRGDAVVPRRRRAADVALARHADPRRQRLPVLRRMVDHHLSRRRAGADRAERQPARRLAARRAAIPGCARGPLTAERMAVARSAGSAGRQRQGPISAVSSEQTVTSPPLEVRHLRVEFPTRARHAGRARRHLVRHRAGRDPRRGRRVRRRQVARPARRSSACWIRRAASPPARSARRRSASTTCRTRRCAASAAASIGAIFQDPLTSLNPLYTDRPAAGRDDPDASADVNAHGGAPPRDPPARGNRHPGRRAAHRPIPAPVLRRHAPARRDRARAGRRAQADRRRRADHRARRVDAGADHLRCSSACAASTAPR